MRKIFSLLLCALSLGAIAKPLPKDGRVDVWDSIPFFRGADLCRLADANGKTRSQYMNQMVGLAQRLMMSGMNSQDILPTLQGFNDLYDQNLQLAQTNLDVTLESTLKAYLDDYYRDLSPREKKISFINGERTPALSSRLDYIAYGTYSLSPSCRGEIRVTLHLIGRRGVTESYTANGSPDTVMSEIASRIFEQYQRTSFPISVKIGNKTLTVIGGLNGSVDRVSDPTLAEEACATLDARLPTRLEMELLDSYGDWSGGVGLGNGVWAMPNGKIYAADLRNPTPVREPWEVNEKSFLYYCVK